MQNAVLKMELLLRMVAACDVRVFIHFFTTQNKSPVEIRKEVCSHHCRIVCIDKHLPYTKTLPYEFQRLIYFGVVKNQRC